MVLLLALLVALSASAQEVESPQAETPDDSMARLVTGITHPIPDVRTVTWQQAAQVGAPAIAALVPLLTDPRPHVVRSAHIAMDRLVCHAGRPGAATDAASVAGALVQELGALAEAAPLSPTLPTLEPGLQGFLAAFREAARLDWETAMQRRRTQQARRDVVYWLGLVGGGAHVPALVALLDDEAVAGEAVRALARIPGGDADRSLIDALATSAGAVRIEIIGVLGAREVRDAAEPLAALAREQEDRSVLWACIDALARLGVPPAEALPPHLEPTAEDRVRYADAALRTAHALVEQGKRNQAERIFASFAEMSARRSQIRAALRGLGEIGSPKLVRLALGQLNSPGVRACAIGVLAEMEGREVEQHLRKAYSVAEPSMRAAILEVLARRQSEALSALLDAARNDDAPELRVVAARLSDMPPSEGDLLELAVRGAPWARSDALRSYLDLAHAWAIAGDAEGAALQFREILDGPFDADAQREALEGLGAIARQEDGPFVEAFLDDPYLAETAQSAWARIVAAAPNHDRACQQLAELARSTPYDQAAVVAVRGLEDLGLPAQPFAQARGFVTDWHVVGPFAKPEGETPKPVPAPPLVRGAGSGLPRIEYGGVAQDWQGAIAQGVPAIVDLRALLGARENVSAYALAQVAVPDWRTVRLYVGSDAGCELWLNGEKLHSALAPRPLRVDDDEASGVLRPGSNWLLLHVLQDTGDWGYCVRVTQRDGTPVDLSQQAFPDDGTAGVGIQPTLVQPEANELLP